MADLSTGLEALTSEPPGYLKGKRVGLLVNQASVDRNLVHAKELMGRVPQLELAALFGPQHGFLGTEQANMIETGHETDPELGIPIYSLYRETRTPTEEMLADIDAVVVDLQDVGTRVYTFASTLTGFMEEAGEAGILVAVLDRPNPVGGEALEGNLLEPGAKSFVGLHPIPMRHGLTLGELARMIAGPFGVSCELEVVAMKGWEREMGFHDTALPWVAPSPNLPSPETCLLYAGFVILEATNISEGRGTTLPFHLFGAPWLRQAETLEAINRRGLEGVAFRTTSFRPTFDKWAGEVCRGFQVHVKDPATFRPLECALVALKEVMNLHPEEFRWAGPPYEYDYERMPIDLIMGRVGFLDAFEDCPDPRELAASWKEELSGFQGLREPFLIY